MSPTFTRWWTWLGVCLLILCATLNVDDIAGRRPMVSLNVVGMAAWYAGVAALQAQANGDTLSTIAIPMTWYWWPLPMGWGLSVVVCLVLSASFLARVFKPSA